ncbi:hypothetical protein [Bacillus weihaiensis]|uniref:DUF4901 domain-containing protein n=1 Tax=Bacillus weihaiensis TaxID=1547283 RepID=A0A1L3MRG1_9BACI|nr:hypothetical protein [Bacillus weihaiensis]APH04955.1 hypothetical protein A9C19_09435 [Bacillus weihaiensis]
MKKLVEKLTPFIKGSPVLKLIEGDFTYELIDNETGEIYGFVTLDDGKFVNYEINATEDFEEIEMVKNAHPLSIDKILEVAQSFVDSFIEADVHFSMLNEWSSNHFMVTYEERDPKLGILIPHTGCTLHFTKDGLLTNANIGTTDFTLEYPEVIVTSDEAKSLLRKSNYVQLSFTVNGLHDEEMIDPNVDLVYRSNHNIMGVDVNGKLDFATNFIGIDDRPVEKLQPITVTTSLEELLGIESYMEKKAGEEETSIWVDSSLPFDEENPEPLLTLSSNDTGYYFTSFLPYTEQEGAQKLSLETLTNKACELVELLEGNIHSKYVLEKPIVEEEEVGELFDNEDIEDEFMNDDLFPLYEPTQSFTFYRVHGDIIVELIEAHVQVGLYTGLIKECSVTKLPAEKEVKLQELLDMKRISLEEAEEIYFQDLEMKLARNVKCYDNPAIYTLAYLVDFPKTSAHIERINALTGEVSYVETGILKEGI